MKQFIKDHAVIKTTIGLMLVLGVAVAGGLITGSDINAAQAGEGEVKKLQHLVLLKFKDDATAEQITEIETEFKAMSDELEIIRDFEWGTHIGDAGRTKGFTHSFLVTFHSEDDLKAYIAHPTHQAFTQIAFPVMGDLLVLDYWAK